MEAEQEMEQVGMEPVSALQLLQSVYQNPTVGLTTRMRAAMACLPFESPKLAVTAVIAENDFATVLDRRLKRRRTQSKQRQLSMARRLTFACLQWCLIDASGGFDPLPGRKGFGYSKPTTSSPTQSREAGGLSEAPSLG